MEEIYSYSSYKKFVNDWIAARPKKGRGQLLAMSKFLGVHSTMMSHVFKRDAELSEEQSCRLAEYLGLNEVEADFFIMLVQFQRAGTFKLEKLLLKRIELKRKEMQKVEARLSTHKNLTEENKAIFYSSWHYSGVRLLANLEKSRSVDELQRVTGLPRKKLQVILKFLVGSGILNKEGEEFVTGTSKTHISSDSPHIWKHHQNWRIKAMERYQQLNNDEEVLFTAPLTISRKDIPRIRERVLKCIEEVSNIVGESGEEELCCLNIDWVHFYE